MFCNRAKGLMSVTLTLISLSSFALQPNHLPTITIAADSHDTSDVTKNIAEEIVTELNQSQKMNAVDADAPQLTPSVHANYQASIQLDHYQLSNQTGLQSKSKPEPETAHLMLTLTNTQSHEQYLMPISAHTGSPMAPTNASHTPNDLNRAISKSVIAHILSEVYPINILRIENDVITVNAGHDTLSKGDRLQVYAAPSKSHPIPKQLAEMSVLTTDELTSTAKVTYGSIPEPYTEDQLKLL